MDDNLAMHNEDDWEECIAQMLAQVKEQEESIISKWLKEIGYNAPVGYYRNVLKQEMEIYTTRPGVLIGKHGVCVERLKQMLQEYFSIEYSIKFIEIRGGFVQI